MLLYCYLKGKVTYSNGWNEWLFLLNNKIKNLTSKAMSKKNKNNGLSLIGLAMGILVLFLFIKTTTKMLYLKYYGEPIKGVVQSVYKIGSKGRYNCEYTFQLENKFYEGEETYKGFQVGDSVIILYYSLNPEINTLQQKIFDGWYFKSPVNETQ